MPSIRLAAVSLLLLLGSPPPSAAFDSYPFGAPHDRITEEALAARGFGKGRIKAVKREVRTADWNEAGWRPGLHPATWFRIAPTADYRAAHHFDRGPDASDAEAFAAGARFVRECRAEVLRAVADGEDDEALVRLGRGLHAVQDLASHSNLIGLAGADRALVVAAIFGEGPPVAPAALRLTGYAPGVRDPERPPGDEYSHAEFAKDNARKNDESRAGMADGRTKFETAFALAVLLSERFLVEIEAGISAADWDRLRGL